MTIHITKDINAKVSDLYTIVVVLEFFCNKGVMKYIPLFLLGIISLSICAMEQDKQDTYNQREAFLRCIVPKRSCLRFKTIRDSEILCSLCEWKARRDSLEKVYLRWYRLQRMKPLVQDVRKVLCYGPRLVCLIQEHPEIDPKLFVLEPLPSKKQLQQCNAGSVESCRAIYDQYEKRLSQEYWAINEVFNALKAERLQTIPRKEYRAPFSFLSEEGFEMAFLDMPLR